MLVPRVAAIHDLSGLGRCSLTAAIPILAAMGVQACPLPTAVLSNQTGFPGYTITGLTDHMERSMEEWAKQKARFDGIYTGFLADEEQVGLACRFIDVFGGSGSTVLVDPVLGDNGELYPCFTPAMIPSVRELARKARVITPNLTEACLLAGIPYPRHPDEGFVLDLARHLAEMGPRTVIVSGIHREDSVCNLAWLQEENRSFMVCNRRVGGGYSGTGDILASVLCAALVRGGDLETALRKGTALFDAAISDAFEEGSDPNEGIPFERHLHLLI